MRLRVTICALGCLALAACAGIPDSGPDPQAIHETALTHSAVEPAAPVTLGYALVEIDECVARNATDIGPGSFYRSFHASKKAAPETFVGVGDVIQLTIFESKSGGLFIPAQPGTISSNSVTLPAQVIDDNGIVTVPYTDGIRGAGRRIADIQEEIVEKLSSRAIEPQVVLTMVEQNSSMVSVVGEVNAPAKLAIRRGGERVLDMIAKAGGIKYPGYDSYVMLDRGKRHGTVYFDALVRHPEENIYVTPGDTIYVYREPRRFLAFGANAASGIGISNQFDFGQEKVSLAEGVAKAGGLLDGRAEPGQVFLYRLEQREVLQAMQVDLAPFPPQQEVIPTIYRANFRDPASYFFAQQFPMRMRDVIYLSNADAIEAAKIAAFIRIVTGTAVEGVTQDAGLTRHNLRYLAKGWAPGF